MLPDFVDREERNRLIANFQRSLQPGQTQSEKLIMLEKSAGMGKTYLMGQVCQELIANGKKSTPPLYWKFVYLDISQTAGQVSKRWILENIARQFCSNITWETLVNQHLCDDDRPLKAWEHLADYIEQNQDFDIIQGILMRTIPGLTREDMNVFNAQLMAIFKQTNIFGLTESDDFEAEEAQVKVLVNFLQAYRDDCECQENPYPNRAILILDSLDEIQKASLLKWVLNELCPSLQEAFPGKVVDNFFVIVLGRFIGNNVDTSGRYYTRHRLKTFSTEVVKDYLMLFKDRKFNLQSDQVYRLARKLAWECGGHPRILRVIAEYLYNHQKAHFHGLYYDPYDGMYWFREPEVQALLLKEREAAIDQMVRAHDSDIARGLRLLCVFRQFDSVILEFMIQKVKNSEWADILAPKDPDAVRLFNNIESQRLIGGLEHPPFHSGHVVLRLGAAQMRTEKPEMYQRFNAWALDLFRDWVQGRQTWEGRLYPNASDQKLFASEWLFHRLCMAGYALNHPVPAKNVREEQLLKEIRLIVDGLKDVLNLILPNSKDPLARRRLIDSIKDAVDPEKDEDIDYLIWEMAWEDKRLRDKICVDIQNAFS